MEWCNGTEATTGPRVLVVVWCCQLTVQQHHHRLVLYTATALTHLFRLFGLNWEGLVTVARCRATPNIDKTLALTLLLPLHEPIMYILHEYCLLLELSPAGTWQDLYNVNIDKTPSRMIGKWISWLNVTECKDLYLLLGFDRHYKAESKDWIKLWVDLNRITFN